MLRNIPTLVPKHFIKKIDFTVYRPMNQAQQTHQHVHLYGP